MKQIYYAIQSILHGRGSNVTKVISLSLGLTIGILLFSQIAFELNYEKCYPEADRLVLVRGGGENVKDMMIACLLRWQKHSAVICHNGLKMLQSFSILRH